MEFSIWTYNGKSECTSFLIWMFYLSVLFWVVVLLIWAICVLSTEGLPSFKRPREPKTDPSPTGISRLDQDHRRSLSINEDCSNIESPQSLQPNSPLFSKLPYEVRQIVFQHAIGWNKVHIIACTPKGLQHCICTADWFESVSSHRESASVCLYFWQSNSNGGDDATKHLLGRNSGALIPGVNLIHTCRLAYTECIPLLYSQTVFDMSWMKFTGLSVFAPSIPLSHLRQIRYLDLEFRTALPGSDDATACFNDDVIALRQMTALRRLRVRLSRSERSDELRTIARFWIIRDFYQREMMLLFTYKWESGSLPRKYITTLPFEVAWLGPRGPTRFARKDRSSKSYFLGE